MARIIALAVLLAAVHASVEAGASPFRVEQLPNAPNECRTCHAQSGGSELNAFGADVDMTLIDVNVNWPAVCPLDSDQDGFSNGVELGDPSCTWQEGMTATGPVYDPADPAVSPARRPDAGGAGPTDAAAVDTGPRDARATSDVGARDAGAHPDASRSDAGVGTGAADDGCRCTTQPRSSVSFGVIALVGCLARRAPRRRRRNPPRQLRDPPTDEPAG